MADASTRRVSDAGRRASSTTRRSRRRAAPARCERAPGRPAQPAPGRGHGRRWSPPPRPSRRSGSSRSRPAASRRRPSTVAPVPPTSCASAPAPPCASATRPARTPTRRSAIGVPSVRVRRAQRRRSTPRRSRTSDAGHRRHVARLPRCCASRRPTGRRSPARSRRWSTCANFHGFSAAACAEPSGSIWLAGGATTVGPHQHPDPVEPDGGRPPRSTLQIFGEDGEVEAPGMTGIDVPAGCAARAVARRLRARSGVAGRARRGARRAGRRLPAAVDRARTRRHRRRPGGCRARSGDGPHLPRACSIFDVVGTNRALSLDDWDDVAAGGAHPEPRDRADRGDGQRHPARPRRSTAPASRCEAEPGVVTEVGARLGRRGRLRRRARRRHVHGDDERRPADRRRGARLGGRRHRRRSRPRAPIAAPGVGPRLVRGGAGARATTRLVDDRARPRPDPRRGQPDGRPRCRCVLEAQGGADITLVVPAGGAASTAVGLLAPPYVLREPAGLFVAVTQAASDDRMARSAPRRRHGPSRDRSASSDP